MSPPLFDTLSYELDVRGLESNMDTPKTVLETTKHISMFPKSNGDRNVKL